jgi:hypothetical protein
MLKLKKYIILEELFTQELLSKPLAIQISDNIESIFNNESLIHNDEWMHLIPHVDVEDQLTVVLLHSRCWTVSSETK